MVDQAISSEMLCEGGIGREQGIRRSARGHGMGECEMYLCDYVVAETTCGGSEAVSGEICGHNRSES